MTPLLLVGLAAITYGSRLAAMVALPRPTGRIEAILARVPAAIFASLATLSLITPERTVVETPILLAALGAALAAPRRSFALCLVAGVIGYAVGEAVIPLFSR
jgi:branched-subunit amino acid transport protein